MSQVISATAKFRRSSFKREEFLGKARYLLADAKRSLAAGDKESALEFAYQAALRTAGARVADSKVATRARKPQSAWEQLRLVDEEGAAQAAQFSAYSRLRSRVASGLEFNVEEGVVRRLVEQVEGFIFDVESVDGQLPAAA